MRRLISGIALALACSSSAAFADPYHMVTMNQYGAEYMDKETLVQVDSNWKFTWVKIPSQEWKETFGASADSVDFDAAVYDATYNCKAKEMRIDQITYIKEKASVKKSGYSDFWHPEIAYMGGTNLYDIICRGGNGTFYGEYGPYGPYADRSSLMSDITVQLAVTDALYAADKAAEQVMNESQ